MKLHLPWAKKPEKPQEAPKAVTPGGFFSTDIDPRYFLLTQAERQRQLAEAMRKTFQRGIENLVPVAPNGNAMAGGHAMDEIYEDLTAAKLINQASGNIPSQQLEWYASQGFIGWQTCAILAQQWLIDKACTMPGDDAIRHGWELNAPEGVDFTPEMVAYIKRLDKRFGIKKQLRQYVKFTRVFGIRVAHFIVDGISPEIPFNPDGVRPGSYRGIAQIDPYWISPMLDRSAAGNPAAMDFYEPTWWLVNSTRIHRTHLAIARNGDEVADILKPSYIYGGIPTPQKIFERVYAAERTANEAPMLAMTKRLTALQMDLTAGAADPETLRARMELWTSLMNNFGIKVIGQADNIQQFDTSLAELDATIMTQYQLVAAASNVPATKLLGTTPKGFNSTGEYDESSYHEYLESMQENELTPFLEAHYTRLMRSYVAPKFGIQPFEVEIAWKPVDSPTAAEMAEINLKKAQTGSALVASGAIDGHDERMRLINDPDSGYLGMEEIVEGGPGDREAEQEQRETQEALVAGLAGEEEAQEGN